MTDEQIIWELSRLFDEYYANHPDTYKAKVRFMREDESLLLDWHFSRPRDEGKGSDTKKMNPPKRLVPTEADILTAITKAETGDCIDPMEVPINWECKLYSPENHVFDGHAHTAPEAMALAWLHAWAPDALTNRYVEPGTVPLEVPAGWRFELTPPYQSKSA